jgi:hypothetical protein
MLLTLDASCKFIDLLCIAAMLQERLRMHDVSRDVCTSYAGTCGHDHALIHLRQIKGSVLDCLSSMAAV